MSDTVTIVHMAISFATSVVVGLLSYLKFKDSSTAGKLESSNTKEDSSLERRLTILETQRAADKERLDRLEGRLDKK